MNKGKVARLAGFVGALGLSTVLVTTAVQGTGAWFSDTSTGSISSSSGHLTLLTRPVDNTTAAFKADRTLSVDFSNMMPGARDPHSIDYKVDASSGNVDLWLVFDTTGSVTLPNSETDSSDTKTGSPYQLFTGGGSDDNTGMGRYGFFKVSDSNGGQAFVSGNLKFSDSSNNAATNGCSTDAATGRGGSATEAASLSDYPPYCGVPQKIMLAWGLASGTEGTVSVTFGTNGPLTTWQNQPQPTVPFTLVAVQAGHTP